MDDDSRPRRAVWEIARRLTAHPNQGIRAIGVLILVETAAELGRFVQLSYEEIEAETGIPIGGIRSRLDTMEKEQLIVRSRHKGKPKNGQPRSEPRGDYYALACASQTPGEKTAPTRAGPTRERLGGDANSPEPHGGSVPPVKGAEPSRSEQA